MAAATKAPDAVFVPAGEGTPARPAEPRRRRPARSAQRTVYPPNLTPEVLAYLDRLSLAQLVCLAYGHIWPVLIPGRGRPRGWSSFPDHRTQGVFMIREYCVRDDTGSSCGTLRTSNTEANGIWMERGVRRQYKRDNDVWKIRPQGSRISRVDVYNYIMFRMADELFAVTPELGEGAIP